jgi:excisionase family DNA binding protein
MVTPVNRALPDAQALLTVRQAADYLALSRSKIYGLMDAGQLPHVKLGRARRIRSADVLRLIDACTVGTDVSRN